MDSTQPITQPAPTESASADSMEQPSMDSMYQVEWVQKLLSQIQDCLRQNSSWLGIDTSKPQRILDYACGNGTVSTALLGSFPKATFHGIDILDSQVKLYNDEALKLLGPLHRDRMWAVQGDLDRHNESPALSSPDWFGFDSVVISFALHHVDDPIDLLDSLKARVKPGGTVVVVDWLKEAGADTASNALSANAGVPKYNPDNMMPVPMGKIWPGFSLQDIREDYEAAGLTDVDVRIHPDLIELPQQASFGGSTTMYISKATVPSTLE